ncbi:MAG: hypothetical protein JWO30_3303 [Fibrobacteres bacterium]|nr:hypothetical protein [Fibrobacterota bacterium]
MIRIKTILPWACALATAGLSAFPAFSQAPDSLINKLSAAEKKAGWISLFDGVDPKVEWRAGVNGTTLDWKVEDGALTPSGAVTEVFSKQSYGDFEWSVEWKLGLKGNSGMFFRVNPQVGRFCSSSEYAILDDVNGDDRTELGHMPGQTQTPIKRSGACYDLYPTTHNGGVDSPYVLVSKPYDQWSRGVIWAEGAHIEHWLNDQKVVDYELFTGDWNTRFSLSKYPAMCTAYPDKWMRAPSGLIGLQDHGGGLRVWFRNLKIRPFTPGEKLVSPLITPAGGLEAAPVKVVLEAAVTGSVIRYTLDGSLPTEPSPIYTGPLTLDRNTTLKARTFRNRFSPSDVTTEVYVFKTTGLQSESGRAAASAPGTKNEKGPGRDARGRGLDREGAGRTIRY